MGGSSRTNYGVMAVRWVRWLIDRVSNFCPPNGHHRLHHSVTRTNQEIAVRATVYHSKRPCREGRSISAWQTFASKHSARLYDQFFPQYRLNMDDRSYGAAENPPCSSRLVQRKPCWEKGKDWKQLSRRNEERLRRCDQKQPGV